MKRQNINVYVPFKKSDDALRMVYGYCTSEALDSQGEVILHQAIIKAWDNYMEFGNIREMHQPSAVGVTKEFMHDDNGTWIGVKVVDDRAWKFVQEGVYKGFSIGGRVLKKSKNIIEEIILSEISLVDRPANPDAKFSVTKMDDGLVDQLQLEANKFLKMKHKFVEIDGKKYKEDPANPGQPLKDETTGESVELTAEEVAENEAGEGDDVTETAEEIAAREQKEKEDANVAAGLNPDGSVKEAPAPAADEGAGDQGAGEGAGDDGQKAAKSEFVKKAVGAGLLAKDSNGVIMLADLLSHLEYIMYCFKGDERDVSALSNIQAELMKAIAAQTAEGEAEKGTNAGDLAKAMGSELSKAMAPVMEKMGTLEKSVGDLTKEVDAIKNLRVSPRPAGSAKVVEKGFENGAGGADSKTLAEKRQAVEDVKKEIDEFSKTMGEKVKLDPSLSASFLSKSSELHTKLSKAKLDLSEANKNFEA